MGFFMDDDEYIYMCRKGNDEAWLFLFNRYRSFIYSWIDSGVTTYRYLSHSREEIFQMMAIVWHNSVESYREDFGLFYAYAKLCVQRDLLSYLRQETSDQARHVKHTLSLDEPIDDTSSMTYGDMLEGHYWNTNPSETYCVNETWHKIERVIDYQIDELERRVFDLHQQGYDYETIAQHEQLSTKKIDNILQKIKRRIKSEIGTE